MEVYKTGDVVTCRNLFKVSGALTDPTTVTLTIVTPAGVSTAYTYAAAEITRNGTGDFQKNVNASPKGVWRGYWTGTGAAADVEDFEFVVYDPADIALYVGVDEFKSLLGISDTTDDLQLESALHAACRSIDNLCGRRFYPDTTATARTFVTTDACLLHLGADFYTTTGLAVKTDQDYDGVFEITWATTDFQLEPLDGVVDGTSGWPYNRIRAIYNYLFPPAYRGRSVIQITAKWGWAAPPEPVRQAAKLLAKDLFKNKDIVGGVLGTDQFGAVRVRRDPFIDSLLAPYKRFGIG